MNKILKFFKRRILGINSRADREMVNLSQFSPSRVSVSKPEKQDNVEVECQQVRDDGEPQKKSRNIGRPRRKKKTKKQTGEVNSVRASRGSICTVSLLHINKPPDIFPNLPTKVPFSSPRHLHPTPNPLSLKSPPIDTISADTPERSNRFHKQIEDVAECRLRVLGKGSIGTIIQATYKGELVAAKIVPPQKTISLNNELNNFLVSHPNIVKTLRIISSDESHSCGLVIMEMCSSITLEHLSNEDSYSLSEKSIVRFMTDIGSALDHCHKQGVLHLDVKPQNILVNVTTNVCKLCDFGSSCLFLGEEDFADRTESRGLQMYTIVYTSPELLSGKRPTEKSDVYSFGITMWQLVHREKPYVVDNKIDLQSTIYEIVKQRKRPQTGDQTVQAMEKLYTKCWEHEPANRPSMKEVLQFLESITF